MARRPAITPVVLLLGGAVFLFAAAFALVRLESHDLWWHLRTGQIILAQGRPPAHNLYSYTAPGYKWVTHEWLTEALFFWIYDRQGPLVFIFLKPLIIGCTFMLAYWLAWRESGSPWWSAGAAVLGAYAARCTFDIRPQIITYLFLTITLLAIARHRDEGGPEILALVPLIWIWANLHSGFITGLILLAMAALTMPRRAPMLLTTLALGILVALLTPNLWDGLMFPIRAQRYTLMLDTLTEWFSPDFHSVWMWGLEAFLLALLAALALSPWRIRAFDLVTVLAFGHMVLRHQRHVTLFVLVAAPVLASHLAEAMPPLLQKGAETVPSWVAGRAGQVRAWWLNLWRASPIAPQQILAVAALVGGLVLFNRDWPAKDPFATLTCRNTFPIEATEYLRGLPPMRMYNTYIWGGYLVQQLFPQQKVFIDGRADAYPPEVLQDYLSIERVQPGWQRLLDNYKVDTVVYRANTSLTAALAREPGWQRVYQDNVAEIYRRRPAGAP